MNSLLSRMSSRSVVMTIARAMITSECKSVEMHHDAFKLAVSIDQTRFNLKYVSINDIKRGFVCRDSKQDTPKKAESFQAKVYVLQHLIQIQNGYTPDLDCHTSHIACKFKEIPSKIDR
ncbi:MAG: putative translation elongation factor-1 alpha [Streblomastix strix]|uniref:Putative translation elongation factor-1 alpha n=1 Tax=Streblomastix strix TaxID=222440 RepID=A0A5J4XA98_9EUKA|nr:MAG: putative translation elongation factor-1 alpha [Streblomastix strix]